MVQMSNFSSYLFKIVKKWSFGLCIMILLSSVLMGLYFASITKSGRDIIENIDDHWYINYIPAHDGIPAFGFVIMNPEFFPETLNLS